MCSEALSSHRDTLKKEKKYVFFPCDENSGSILLRIPYIMCSSVNYLYHVVHYMPMTYLSQDCKFVPFHCLHLIPPLATPHLIITNLIFFFFCKLSFIWGEMRTAPQETVFQIALRNCSEEARGEPGYIGVLQQKGRQSERHKIIVN